MKSPTDTKKRKRKVIVTVEEAVEAMAHPVEEKLADIEPGKQDWSLINKLQDLVDRPLPAISDLVAAETESFFKCLLREKIWFEMGQYSLDEYNTEFVNEFIEDATYVEVTFHVRRLEASQGCGSVDLDYKGKSWVGFASGKKMYEGIVHADSKQHIVKYNRKLLRFEVDGKHVVGAEAIILARKCEALVINPKYADE